MSNIMDANDTDYTIETDDTEEYEIDYMEDLKRTKNKKKIKIYIYILSIVGILLFGVTIIKNSRNYNLFYHKIDNGVFNVNTFNSRLNNINVKDFRKLAENINEVKQYYIEYKNITDYELISNEIYSDISEDTLHDYLLEKVKISKEKENIMLKSFKVPVPIDDFVLLRRKEEIHTTLWNIVFGMFCEKDKDGHPIMSKEILTDNDTQFLTQKDVSKLSTSKKLLATIHQSLYPWLYHHHYDTFNELIGSFKGRGIVISTGDRHYNLVRSSIDIFRNVLNCTLPVEVFYIGEKDLSEERRKTLSELPDVYVSDLTHYFDNDIVKIGGWAAKPFALLASRFDETILMDADAAYIRNPSILFEDEGYKETGTLYFRDRTREAGVNRGNIWLKSWMVDPLPESSSTRFYKTESHHEVESSTIVIHKSRNILGLLNICKMNEQKIRDEVVYTKVYGDKETFWMGFDMARQHFNILENPIIFVGELTVGEIGQDKTAKQLCGHVGHMTRDGKVLYWNDHIIKDKFNKYTKNGQRILNFEAYFIERGVNSWANPHCLNYEKKNYGEKPILFNEEDRRVIDKIIERENKYHYVLPLKQNDIEERDY